MRVTKTGVTKLLWCGLIAGSLAAGACSSGTASEKGPAVGGGGRGGGGRGGDAAVPVTVAVVERKSVPLDLQAIGTAEAFSNVAVHAQITGELTSVNFKEGDDISAGQVLFTLDRRPFEAALQQAEANLQRDLAQAANAEAQQKRYRDLAERGIATREQVDTASSNAAALQATVGADRAAIDNARIQLQYATIASPIAGRTGALMVYAGNLVRANDTTPLVVINQISPIYVTFSIPESQLPNLKRYMAAGSVRVEAQPPSDSGSPAVGRITFVDNSVDQTTGTIKVKAVFPNEDRRLWPGQYANVRVTLTTDPGAIVVPSLAVQAGPTGSYVYVIKTDQRAELRPVEVDRIRGNESVLKSGVSAGETVVTDGHLRLTVGTRVSIKGDNSRGDASKAETSKPDAPKAEP
jgi:multidrug efflux system membrane fusion protein